MRIWAAAVGVAALWACAAGGPAAAAGGAAIVPSAQGSPYAVAKASCARQGKRMSLVSSQTDDTGLASGGIRVGFVCVAGPAKAAAKPARRTSRAAPRPR